MILNAVSCALLSILLQLGSSPGRQECAWFADDAGVRAEEVEQEPAEEIGSFEDYFPTAKGTRWEYAITLEGSASPLGHEYVFWPGQDNMWSRSVLHHASLGPRDQVFRLVLEVKDDNAPRQGPLQYPQGIELEVVEDDLEIFGDYTHVYWAITSSGWYRVTQVVTRPAERGWERRDMADGYSWRLLMFEDSPGALVSLNDEDDKLKFIGPTSDSQLHYQRMVAAFERSKEYGQDHEPFEGLKAFTEDVWFKKGVGLERL